MCIGERMLGIPRKEQRNKGIPLFENAHENPYANEYLHSTHSSI
jgi:hypothetical protein